MPNDEFIPLETIVSAAPTKLNKTFKGEPGWFELLCTVPFIPSIAAPLAFGVSDAIGHPLGHRYAWYIPSLAPYAIVGVMDIDTPGTIISAPLMGVAIELAFYWLGYGAGSVINKLG